MVRFLLDAGADQEHKTDEMHTALMEACMVIFNYIRAFMGKKDHMCLSLWELLFCVVSSKNIYYEMSKYFENFVHY